VSAAVVEMKLFDACMYPAVDVAENVVGARTGAAAPAPCSFPNNVICSYGIAYAGFSDLFMGPPYGSRMTTLYPGALQLKLKYSPMRAS
jgi:hypothetical protein